MPLGFFDTADGTYRVFATQDAADRYALACWAWSMRRRSVVEGGILNVTTRQLEDLAATWPVASLAEMVVLVNGMNATQLNTLRTKLSQVVWQSNRGEVGISNAWAIPRQTLAGLWAVLSHDPGGVAEPAWLPIVGT